jgi:hypothetical protein
MSKDNKKYSAAAARPLDYGRLGLRLSRDAVVGGLSLAKWAASVGYRAGRFVQVGVGAAAVPFGWTLGSGLDFAEAVHMAALDMGISATELAADALDTSLVTGDAVAKMLAHLHGAESLRSPEADLARKGFAAIYARFLGGIRPGEFTGCELMTAFVAYAVLQRRASQFASGRSDPGSGAAVAGSAEGHDVHRPDLDTLLHFARISVASYGRLAVSFLSGDVVGMVSRAPRADDHCAGTDAGGGDSTTAAVGQRNNLFETLSVVENLSVNEHHAKFEAHFAEKHAGITPGDVLKRQDGGTLYRPAHTVLVDRKTRAIVVVLRGTMSLPDFLTDSVCEAVPLDLDRSSSSSSSSSAQLIRPEKSPAAAAQCNSTKKT